MMPGFRWEVANDIALAMEVVSKRPHKPADWVDIADTLAKAFSTEEKQRQGMQGADGPAPQKVQRGGQKVLETVRFVC